MFGKLSEELTRNTRLQGRDGLHDAMLPGPVESIAPCFTPGSQIATINGQKAVEDLSIDDRVLTRDNGYQKIRWIGAKSLTASQVARDRSLQAVRIRKGALGENLPAQDIILSPHHRVLISSDDFCATYNEREVLVDARYLVGQPGVVTMMPCDITYIHVMFDTHQVILADGSWTESFHPSDASLKGLHLSQRQEIFQMFPELAQNPDIVAPARLTLGAANIAALAI